MLRFQPWHGLTLLHVAAVACGLLLYVALTHSGRQRRPPSAALAWVIALVAFPYLALPIYLLLGTRKLTHCPLTDPGRAENSTAATRGLGLPPARHSASFALHADGQQALEQLLALFRQARQRIDIEVFLFRDDAAGRAIAAALAAAVQRGVQVRMLLDGMGAYRGHHRSRQLLRDAGVQLRWFSPIRLYLRPRFGRGNLRNHRKLVVVDGTWMWSGGRNFASEYFAGDAGTDAWRDLSFVLQGGIAEAAAAGFAHDWALAAGEPMPAPRPPAPDQAGPRVQLLPSGPDCRDDTAHALYLHAFHRADVRIWIATPYFIPDDALQQALVFAARRGVDVRLLLPARSNHRLADIARERSLRELFAAGARLQLLPSMLHAKLVLVDDRFASCGSINLDGRSLFLNHELNTLFLDAEQIDSFSAWHAAQSRQATPYAARRPGWLRDTGEGLVRAVGFQL